LARVTWTIIVRITGFTHPSRDTTTSIRWYSVVTLAAIKTRFIDTEILSTTCFT
jgi:hypothetical protein